MLRFLSLLKKILFWLLIPLAVSGLAALLFLPLDGTTQTLERLEFFTKTVTTERSMSIWNLRLEKYTFSGKLEDTQKEAFFTEAEAVIAECGFIEAKTLVRSVEISDSYEKSQEIAFPKGTKYGALYIKGVHSTHVTVVAMKASPVNMLVQAVAFVLPGNFQHRTFEFLRKVVLAQKNEGVY